MGTRRVPPPDSAMTDTPTAVGDGSPAQHPGFATERLALDPETVVERVHETLGSVTATRTEEGTKFRTPDGTLVALLTVVDETEEDGGGENEPSVLFQYRVEPASQSGTLKARRLWRALERDAT